MQQALRAVVMQRLMVAAEEIVALIEQAFMEEEPLKKRKAWEQHTSVVQKPSVPPEAPLEQTEVRTEVCSSSASPPGHSEHPPSCLDTGNSDFWETSAEKNPQNDTEENETTITADVGGGRLSCEPQKQRKRKHKGIQSGLTLKREREEQETCVRVGAITVLMHEMLAKQRVLSSQQKQIFLLPSTSQLQIQEQSPNYKDLPVYDQQALMAARPNDQDDEGDCFKLIHLSILNDGEDFLLERCNVCCRLYHCPLCPNYKPDKLSRTQKHMQIHKKNAVVFRDKFICRCHQTCRKTGHYHCPFCSRTIMKRVSMEVHLNNCVQLSARIKTAPHWTAPLASDPSAELTPEPTPASSQQKECS